MRTVAVRHAAKHNIRHSPCPKNVVLHFNKNALHADFFSEKTALANGTMYNAIWGAYTRDETISVAITPSLPGMKSLLVGGLGPCAG